MTLTLVRFCQPSFFGAIATHRVIRFGLNNEIATVGAHCI